MSHLNNQEEYQQMIANRGRFDSFNEISQILPNLFLTGQANVIDDKVKALGITHAVDATNLIVEHIDGIEYLVIQVDDNIYAKIDEHFQKVAEFVEKSKNEGGKTLIYCAAGVSRSATFVIMYLVIKHKMTLREAYFKVYMARPIISPNMGFWQQMMDFEQSLTGTTTVTFVSNRTPRPIPDVYLERQKHARLSLHLQEESNST